MANKKYSFDTHPTVSNNTYAGELALPYLAPSVAANSIENGYLTALSGVRNKAVVSTLTSSNPIVASSCDVTQGDHLSLNESVLTTTDVMVNESICRGTLYPTWVASQMNGNRNGEPVDFIDFAAATVSGKASEQVESFIYYGSAALGIGLVNTDGTALTSAQVKAARILNGQTSNWVKLGTFAQATIDDELKLVYDKAVATAPAILSKDDVQFLLSPESYGMYMQHLSSTLGGGGYLNKGTNQVYTQLTYLGIPVNMAYGMPDAAIVLGRKSNMFVGTNLGTDATEVSIIPRYQYDGSDMIQMVMRFGIGVQVGINTEVILGTTIAVS